MQGTSAEACSRFGLLDGKQRGEVMQYLIGAHSSSYNHGRLCLWVEMEIRVRRLDLRLQTCSKAGLSIPYQVGDKGVGCHCTAADATAPGHCGSVQCFCLMMMHAGCDQHDVITCCPMTCRLDLDRNEPARFMESASRLHSFEVHVWRLQE